ncbi:MAG: sensor domain-containing diguanylate cyclase [Polyangiaceae bacterium]|nr:sensor domain-containing diguanylate cyclase [Polyangiaceae bacterium]
MDPLVRGTVRVQELLAKASGTLLACVFAVGLVAWSVASTPSWVLPLGAALLATSTVFHSFGRRHHVRMDPSARFDTALFFHLAVGLYALVLVLPGGLSGPYHPVVYVLVLLAAAFARLGPAVATAVFVVLLEGWLRLANNHRLTDLPVHAALVALFTLTNVVVFRGEVTRVRQLSRRRVEAEILRMKEAARSFRLVGAASVAPSPSPQAAVTDEARLLQSGVDEIGQALKFALDLLRTSLNLKTAVLLWLDESGSELALQEVSTVEDCIEPGPFSAKDGLCAAALLKGEPISVSGARADHHTPYYASPTGVGAVCAVPVIEQGHVRGILMVDRAERAPFLPEEEQQLVLATHFILRTIQNERVYVHLERTKSEQGKLYRAAGKLAAARTEAQVIEAGVASAREVASFDFAVVTLFHRDTAEHEICAVSSKDSEALVGKRFRHNSGLVSMVVANCHALPLRGQYDEARQVVFTRNLRPPPLPSLLVLPLLVHGRPLGTLVLGAERPHAFGDSARPTLEVLASHVAVSLENARLLKRLEEMATTDGMTGLFNKRALTGIAEQKLRSAERFNKPLSLLICDIDHFKKVNDNFGHDVGDVVIAGFGEVLKHAKRDIDVVGRFGGEEFVVVCEETDQAGAALLAERIRQELEAKVFHTEGGPLQVTCSVGVATFPHAGRTWEALFKSTDEALYSSKRNGRNRVTIWNPKLQGCAA